MKLAKEFKISLLLATACYLLLGLVLLFYPAFSITMLCYTLGGITILFGVSYIVSYFSRTDFDEVYNLDFVTGIVLTGGGVYIMVQPIVVAAVLNIVVGLVICLDSLIKLQTAIDLKRLNSRVWWTVLVLCLVTGALGVLLLVYHGQGMLPITQLIGLSLVVDGCVNVWSFSFLTANLSRLRKERKLLQEEELALPDVDNEEQSAEEDERVQSAVASAQSEQPDESVKSSILTALSALRKKPAEVACAAPAVQAEKAVVLKPSAEELSGAPQHADTETPVAVDVPEGGADESDACGKAAKL